jgi:hypothetical protein
MRTLAGLGSVVVWAGLGLLSACSGTVDESKVSGGGGTSSGGSSNGSSGLHIGGGDAGNSGSLSVGGNGSSGNGVGGGESCAAAMQQAELSPVYLVFLLDESGSMGDGKNGKREQKWDPVTAALNGFFADPESAGIMASLSLFPLNKNTTKGAADSSKPADCAASAYGMPEVPPRALPDDKTFAAAIAKLDPPNEYGTPTLPALSGTIDYAEGLLKEDATRKVAIVMVTDGEPYGCDGNTITATAAAAKAVAAHLPTYVIGVGAELDSLNAIAVGGGTEKAFIVALGDATKTQKALLDAINLIRGKSLSCELPLPAPPAGKKLDPDKVNVQFTGTGQAAMPLKYGTACSGDTAWHYDDATKPTKVLLCDDTCGTVKADPTGKLDVVFGCVDRQVVQ